MPRRFFFSFVAMTLALLVSAGLGNAATTLTLNYKAFPSNGNLLNVGTFNVDGAVKLSAPENFYEKGVTYEFLFWDLNGSRNIHRQSDSEYADSICYSQRRRDRRAIHQRKH